MTSADWHVFFFYVVSAELKILSENGSYTVNPDHTVVLPCVVQDQGAKKVRLNFSIFVIKVK